MKPIDKFILHVTHNLFPLNEYSEGEINRLMNKFKEEADDLNISITDNQLKKYIERFDSLKNSPKITEKDLRKYSLSKLIKLVTASKGAEGEDDELEDTPDIVYNENGLIIYNGSKEDNCLTYGAGERWCITKGSFGNYRYDDNRKNPTFYLVKDTNLPNSNPKSFFVVVVGKDNTYKVSDRTNNDVGGQGTEWDRWESWSFVGQHFPSVANLHSVFKYIPLSSKEKLGHTYKNSAMPFREWLKQPFSFKEQYLIIRKGKTFFTDVTNEEFITKFIPKLPNVANILAKNNDIAGTPLLLKTIDSFTKQDQNSIISNIRNPLNITYLTSEVLSFEMKKLLVKLNKWAINNNQRIYTTSDGISIVLIDLDEEISIGIYTEDDDYPDIKINTRTVKYILDYPELDTIPIKYLIGLLENGSIGKEYIEKILSKAKDDPNSTIIVKNVNGEEVVIDTNSFGSYVVKDGQLKRVSFDNEDVQTVFNSLEDKDLFANKLPRIFLTEENIPSTIDKKALSDVIKTLPYQKRTFDGYVILSTDNSFFLMRSTNINAQYSIKTANLWKSPDWNHTSNKTLDLEQLKEYWKFLRATNQTISDDRIKSDLSIGSWTFSRDKKIAYFVSEPPIGESNNLIPKVVGDSYLLINKSNPSQSYKLSGTGKLVKANIPVRRAADYLGNQAVATTARRGRPARGAEQPMGMAQLQARRRGRPPRGQERTPAPQPQAQGEIDVDDLFTEQGLIGGFQNLSTGIRRRLSLSQGVIHNVRGNRGAARRQNMLGNSGAVESVVEFGRSSVYIIRLYPDTRDRVVKIASVVVQPGNMHYIVTERTSWAISSPSDLVATLRQRELLELRSFITREYLERNPTHLEEVKKLLQQHISETKNN